MQETAFYNVLLRNTRRYIMADVMTEMQPDGSQKIIEIKGPSNYDMKVSPLNGVIPETPSLESLSKVFTAKFVLEVNAPDGTIIPFTYKRIDPGTLLHMDASPIQITDELINNLSMICLLYTSPSPRD